MLDLLFGRLRMLIAFGLFIFGACGVSAQYEWQDPTPAAKPDTANPKIEDTLKSAADSVQPRKRLYELYYGEEEGGGDEEVPAPPLRAAPVQSSGEGGTAPALQQAQKWLRRLLFRGKLDATRIGAFATYQITDWDPATGPYGPVQARITVYYLGSTLWQGKDAEWLQATYEALDEEGTLIEFDVIVPASSRIDDVHRLLYRMDRGEIKSGDLSVPANQLDYDRSDRPVSEGLKKIKLYAGTFDAEVLRGSGTDGSEVIVYKTEGLAPLGVVQMGYGNQALTFVRGGSDAAPRFHAPAPPAR